MAAPPPSGADRAVVAERAGHVEAVGRAAADQEGARRVREARHARGPRRPAAGLPLGGRPALDRWRQGLDNYVTL